MRSGIALFIKRNWWRLLIGVGLAYVCLDPRVSFQVQFNGSNAPLEQEIAPPLPVRKKKRIYFTDEPRRVQARAEDPVIERFDLGPAYPKITSSRLQPSCKDQDPVQVQHFIDRFADVVRNEQEKFGIPPSIILANGILQSQAGRASFVRESNNYFALPCTGDWTGDQTNSQEGYCIRVYETAWRSFRDHSLYLTSGSYADVVSQLPADDFRLWAKALETVGFSAQANYDKVLIELIEELELWALD